MAKIIVIGDIHGRNTWMDVINQEVTYDKVIFLGDYFDSREIFPRQWIDNFKEIVQLKRNNPDGVVLLVGNHDYHYMRGVTEIYSGYTPYIRNEIQNILDECRDILQACYQSDKFLFTHAGVTKTWYKNGLLDWCKGRGIDIEDMDLCERINYLFQYAPNQFKFTSETKEIINEFFGYDNFRNEIIWYYNSAPRKKNSFGNRHDTILRWSKSSSFKFNEDSVREPYSLTAPLMKLKFINTNFQISTKV